METIETRALKWSMGNDTGTSSKTLAALEECVEFYRSAINGWTVKEYEDLEETAAANEASTSPV